jgi:hypothetical protein
MELDEVVAQTLLPSLLHALLLVILMPPLQDLYLDLLLYMLLAVLWPGSTAATFAPAIFAAVGSALLFYYSLLFYGP